MAELERVTSHPSVCPHDCPSACSLSVSVEHERIVLTPDRAADMGGGPAFHSTMAEIGRADPALATFGARPGPAAR